MGSKQATGEVRAGPLLFPAPPAHAWCCAHGVWGPSVQASASDPLSQPVCFAYWPLSLCSDVGNGAVPPPPSTKMWARSPFLVFMTQATCLLPVPRGPLCAGQRSVGWAQSGELSWERAGTDRVILSRSGEVDSVVCWVWGTSQRGTKGCGCGHHELACRWSRRSDWKVIPRWWHETGEHGIHVDSVGGVSKLGRQHVQRPCDRWLPWVPVAGGESETLVYVR